MNEISVKWMEKYNLAKQYFEENGNLLPNKNKKFYSKELADWIARERKNRKYKTDYNPEKIKLLDKIGMVWCDVKTALRNSKITKENNCETYCKENGLEYILDEWIDFRSPKEIRYNSRSVKDKISFRCTFCGNEWSTQIYNRTVKFHNCGKCANVAKSYPEFAIKFYLSKETQIKSSYKPDWLNGKEIDIFIPEFNIGIEYDGEKWHNENKINDDLEKSKICKENNVKLFRIKEPNCPKVEDENSIIFYRKKVGWYEEDLNIIIKNICYEIFKKDIDVNILRDSIDILNTVRHYKLKNSIEIKNPKLASLWNYDKNKKLKPSMFSCGCRTEVWWKCDKCQYEWQAAIYSVNASVKKGHSGCPCCSNRILVKGKNDFYTYAIQNNKQYLIKEFEAAQKIGKNKNIDLNNVICCDTTKVSWKCINCGEIWLASFKDRRETKCEKCIKKLNSEKQKIAPYKESLKYLYPEIAELVYDKEKNDPTKIFPKSESEILFNCDNGKEHIPYPMQVKNKTGKKYGCPICKNKMLARGFNDVASKYPEIEKLWDYDKNNNPEILKNAKWNIEKQGEFIPENIIDKTNNTFKVYFKDEDEPVSLVTKINRLTSKLNKDEIINEKQESEWNKFYAALVKYLELKSITVKDIKKRDNTILYENASELGNWIYTQKRKLRNGDYDKFKYKNRVLKLKEIGISS